MKLPFTPNFAYFSKKKYFVDSVGGGIEGEYAVGDGLGEPLALGWFVLTFGPSFWRPKPDRLKGRHKLAVSHNICRRFQ